MNRINLLRFEDLETRRMLSADVSLAAAAQTEFSIQERGPVVAVMISSPASLGDVINDAADIVSRRVEKGFAEAVETLTPTRIDEVIAAIADDPVGLNPVFQPPAGWQTFLDSAPVEAGSIADRFRGLAENVAGLSDEPIVPAAIRSSFQEVLLVARNQLIAGLRERLSVSEESGVFVPAMQVTSVTPTTNQHDAIQERRSPIESVSPERLAETSFATNQVRRDVPATGWNERLEAEPIASPPQSDASLPAIPLRRVDPTTVDGNDNSERVSKIPEQRSKVSIGHWMRDANPTPAEYVVRALVELQVSFGDPVGDFANLTGIADFEFDSLIRADGSITDNRAQAFGGLTILATATIVAGHVMRARQREKHVAVISDSRDVDVFDETVRHEIRELACWG